MKISPEQISAGLFYYLETCLLYDAIYNYMGKQISLFDNDKNLPEGFKYEPDFISAEEENELIKKIKKLPLKIFIFQGYTANRRTISFGLKYDWSDRKLKAADEIPDFLLGIRKRAAKFAGLKPTELSHVLVTEYKPGTAIGWHKDKGVFDLVIGISLLSDCNFRFRKKQGNKWERISLTAESRSVYLLSGEARMVWEHSISAVDKLRYSITFRTLKEK